VDWQTVRSCENFTSMETGYRAWLAYKVWSRFSDKLPRAGHCELRANRVQVRVCIILYCLQTQVHKSERMMRPAGILYMWQAEPGALMACTPSSRLKV
jgi:transposase